MASEESFHDAAQRMIARIDRLILARAERCRAKGWVAVCSCGRGYTLAEWSALPYVGDQNGIEIRNCRCESSITHALQSAEALADECPPTRRTGE